MTMPFATTVADLSGNFLPVKAFQGNLNQVVPKMDENQKYVAVDVHFTEVRILQMNPGHPMWPHPSLTINLPYIVNQRDGKPYDFVGWGRFIANAMKAGVPDIMKAIGQNMTLDSFMEDYERDGQTRTNQIWVLQAPGEYQAAEQQTITAADVGQMPPGLIGSGPGGVGIADEDPDLELLKMIDGCTHADFAQRVLAHETFKMNQGLVNSVINQSLQARFINEGKVKEEDERYVVMDRTILDEAPF